MANYVKVNEDDTIVYPYNKDRLRKDNPNVGFTKIITDEMAASFGVYPVVLGTVPEYNIRTQFSVPASPTLVDGVWTTSYNITNRTASQIQQYDEDVARSNRITRDSLLEETDFYALSDVTMSSEMQSYRQALRDLPDHTNWPHLADADWPTKPSA